MGKVIMRHLTTGEDFEYLGERSVDWGGSPMSDVLDRLGEVRCFGRDRLKVVFEEKPEPVWRNVTAECDVFQGELVHIDPASGRKCSIGSWRELFRVLKVERYVNGKQGIELQSYFIVEKKEG